VHFSVSDSYDLLLVVFLTSGTIGRNDPAVVEAKNPVAISSKIQPATNKKAACQFWSTKLTGHFDQVPMGGLAAFATNGDDLLFFYDLYGLPPGTYTLVAREKGNIYDHTTGGFANPTSTGVLWTGDCNNACRLAGTVQVSVHALSEHHRSLMA
jgi:hypothetical protein